MKHSLALKSQLKLNYCKVLQMLPFSSKVIGPPKGYATDIKEYVESYNSRKPSHPHTFWDFGKGSYTVPHPKKIWGNTDPVEEEVCHYHDFVVSLHKGRLISIPYSVISNDDVLLSELSDSVDTPAALNPIFFHHRLPKTMYLKGKAFVLGTLKDDNNYAHWLTEVLPKLHLLEQANIDLNEIDHFLLRTYRSGFVKEHLAYLGIPEEKIRIIDDKIASERDLTKATNSSPYWHVEADELIVTSVFWKPECWMGDYLKKLYLEEQKSPIQIFDRIYVRRHKTNGRNVVNEENLLNVLKKFGFAIIEAEKYTQKEKALLFNRAKVVVAPHGAGMANLIFCEPNTQVLELRAKGHSSYIIDEFRQLCAALQLDFSLFICKGVGVPSQYNTGANLDLMVDVEAFESMLSELLESEYMKK
ncbi:glycosyltransferase family 61 protein [Rapidithrix thailandica]|uniref:Glycosyltransferase family 61 protein n=1 Tax=Rapidithrix thailandica TaxID=413964 RepID=A0AAW9SBD5_9BACT